MVIVFGKGRLSLIWIRVVWGTVVGILEGKKEIRGGE